MPRNARATRLRIAGHTVRTPEYTVPEAIDLFARLEMEGIEAICHDEYRSAVRTDVPAAVLRELRQRAGGHGLQFAAITPYATDLNSHDPPVAAAHVDLLLRAIEIGHALGAGCIRVYPGRETGGPGRAGRLRHLVEAVRAVSHPAVGIVYDQANLTMLGAEDYREAISLQAPYLLHVHVKDLSFKDRPPEMTSGAVEALPPEAKPSISRMVCEGILPWRKIIAELKSTGYDGWLSIQYERRWYPDLLPPAEIGMKAGADLVRRILDDWTDVPRREISG